MAIPLKVLIVEDNADDALLLVRTLKQGGYDLTYTCVDTAEEVDKALTEDWDIVIADYSMPSFCGLEVLKRLQYRRLDIPFILVSGTIGEEVAVEAMRAGAQDYIMKGHLALVPPAVERELKEAEIRRQHRRSEERFRVVSEVTTDIIYEWEVETGRVQWFGGFDEALGYSKGEIKRTIDAWLELVHPDDRERVQEMVQRRRTATFSIYEQYRMCCKNGDVLFWLDRCAPILNRNGDPVRWVGGCSDVTESKRAEYRLQEYQHRLKSLSSELSLAEERERRRVAEGVHDNICQRLALAKLDMQSLQQTLSDVGTIKDLERMCQSMDTIIEEAHSLTFELSNPVLYEVGLDAAVEAWISRNVQGKYGLACEFSSDLQGYRPCEDVSVFLFQSVRELVTNTIKHAKASVLRVHMEVHEETVSVTIEDDGVGFDVGATELTQSGGFGLFSVRERLEYLGGRLTITSSPGQGTNMMLIAPGSLHHQTKASTALQL